MELNELTAQVVDAAFQVHSTMGPGLLESTYEACLTHELRLRHRIVDRQVELPVDYRGILLDCGYRIDLLVDRRVIVEVKAVEKMIPLFEAQLLTYLKLCRLDVGLLINFNVRLLKDGIKRMVVNYQGPKPSGGS